MQRDVPTARRIARIKERLPSLFSPASPVPGPDLLVGRRRILERLNRARNTPGKSVVVFGEPQVGKTSLARNISRMKTDYFYSASRGDTFETVMAVLLDRYELAWSEQEKKETAGSEKSAGVRIPVADGGLGTHKETTRTLRKPELPLTRGQIALKLQQHKSLLVIDDFHTIRKAERSYFADLIKSLSDNEAQATLMLVGEAENIEILIPNFSQIRTRVFSIQVGRMPNNELESIIERLRLISVQIDDEARKYMLANAGGYPGEVHHYCAEATYILLERIEDSIRREFRIGRDECLAAEESFRVGG